MPQEFQILRCCDCEKFQVHHVKKAKKWLCKVCGQKQSLKRAFFIGSSRDCRINVQELNFQAGEREMRQKLDESCNSTDVHDENHSLNLINEDLDLPTENDWVDENDEIFESDWADENDWIDEDDGFDENPSDILDSSSNENLQNNLDDELPRKKKRCESYSEAGAVEETVTFIQLSYVVENQKDALSGFKSMKDMIPCKSIESANNNPSTKSVPTIETKQEDDSVKYIEGSLSRESENSKLNSILKPTHGFQLILNEAKKQRTHTSFDLDF